MRTRERAQRLRKCMALTTDPGSVPSTQRYDRIKPLVTPILGDPMPSAGISRLLYIFGAPTSMKTHTAIYKMKNNSLQFN